MSLARGWVLAAVVLWTTSAQATQVVPVGVGQMARESAVVVRARVGKQEVRWDAARERLLTFTELDVLEGYKGARVGDRLTVYQVGGRLDGVVMEIQGAIRLSPDEEIILFAQRLRDHVVSYGVGLGKLVVFERGKERLVAPDYGDVTWASPRGTPREAPLSSEVPLATLEQRIREAIAVGGAR